jgi:hypothetical protein
MAVSPAGIRNHQATTWVICILAASAKVDLDAMAARVTKVHAQGTSCRATVL